MDPATQRFTTPLLAKHAGGRCLSIRFRLSPPPGSFHEPVSPSRIVVAGDSSGAGLGSALVLLLLTFRSLNITHLRFHGKDVDISGLSGKFNAIPAPPVAGLALASPWLDVSRSLPSVYRNAKWDILAPPPKYGPPSPAFPPDSIWPTKPPRVETYCEANMVTHPLVSPMAAQKQHWVGAPPLYMNMGWELMQDEAEVFARRLYSAGATVVFDGYDGMPHCFQMVRWNWQGHQALQNWGHFCHNAVSGKIQRQDVGTWTDKRHAVTKVKLENLGSGLEDSDVDRLLLEQKERRVLLEKQMRGEFEQKSD